MAVVFHFVFRMWCCMQRSLNREFPVKLGMSSRSLLSVIQADRIVCTYLCGTMFDRDHAYFDSYEHHMRSTCNSNDGNS